MMKIAAAILLSAIVGSASPTRAAVVEDTPYYMCFGYTEDGMLFAGGDFDFGRAQKMVAANCSLPKNITVVLMKTILVRRHGKTYSYAVRER
jgi:hypothetical protein